MSVLAIACDNCGAKYRLPESFSGAKAKCQKCGSVIDVAAQRMAATTPTAPSEPTSALPAAAAKKPTARAAAKAEGTAPRAARTKKDGDTNADGKPARGRKEKETGERAPKKSNTMLLAGGGVAALAVIAVIVVLATGGKDKPATTATAQASPTSKPAESATPSPSNAAPAAIEASADKAKPKAVEAAAAQNPAENKPAEPKAADGKPAEQGPAQPAAQAKPASSTPASSTPAGSAPSAATEPKTDASKPADTDAKSGNELKERWEANKTTSLAEVYKPSVLGEVSWPAECEQAKKEEIVSLIEDVCGGGKPGIAAKPKLEKIGYFAIFGLVDRLRKLDYSSGDDQMTAWELNKLVEAIASGMNAGFVAVEAGGDLDPRKADHNARTNIAWERLLSKFESKADFDTWRKERQNKSK